MDAQNKQILGRLQITPEAVKKEREMREAEKLKMLEMGMTAVGLTATGILLLLVFALVSYWVSPWAVVSILSLAALIWLWTRRN